MSHVICYPISLLPGLGSMNERLPAAEQSDLKECVALALY